MVYPKHDLGGGHHNGESRVQAVKDTWYRNWQKVSDQIDLKFFYGRWPTEATRKPEDNEVFLDCRDDYYGLPEKVQAIFKWCLDNDYEAALKVDDDVWIHIPRLLSDLDSSSDYRGHEIEMDIPFASGTAYWLSRRAMEAVAQAEIDPKEWREDHHVGSVLARKDIFVTNDERYHSCHCSHCMTLVPESQRITSHTVDPRRLYELMESC